MVLTAFAFLFMTAYGVLIFIYRRWWKELDMYVPQKMLKADALPFISVLIAARNEAHSIPQLMLALQAQSYPVHAFEVILIDDYSEDDTVEKAGKAALVNLRIISAGGGATSSSKKKAIASGVEVARGELLVCTDADCLPPPDWLTIMATFYAETGASFIAAPVAYHYHNTPLQILQTIDFLTLQGITAASVHAHFHTMCNGANLAYTKKAFEGVGGFAGIDAVASGDDMLLMHKIWKKEKEKVYYLKSADTIVVTKPMLSWKAFIQQRIRWASKTTYYKDRRVFWTLMLIYFVNLVFFILLVGGFWNPVYFLVALLFVMLKTLIETPFVADVAMFYGQQRLMRYFFLLQPLHMFYTVSIGLLSQCTTYRWKGRQTK